MNRALSLSLPAFAFLLSIPSAGSAQEAASRAVELRNPAVDKNGGNSACPQRRST